MNYIKWILIIVGMVFGTISPWRYQVVVLVALLLGYAACFEIKLPKFQIALESLFGGVSTGLGLHFLIGFGSKNDILGMVVAPLIIWLVLRVIFYSAETKYTLHPNAVLTQMRAEEEAAPYFDESADFRNNNQTTASAWSGNNSGTADLPDETGQRMTYEYFDSGEIAMGGPTYGEAIFSNKCAFTGVGPSIVLSEDGRYAAMTQPSRNGFGLLIADLLNKRVYQPENPGFWEFDRILNGVIIGRHSPITHNTRLELSIEKTIATAEQLPMVLDDGWWVIDYQGREPFKQYSAVTITSKQGTHKITFVPDLKPFKNNPFLAHSHPNYTVLVDDTLIEFEHGSGRAEAIWVDGLNHEKVKDGRFLVLPSQIIDFKDDVNDVFSIEKRNVKLFAHGVDEHTYTSFSYGEKADLGNGNLEANGYVLPRSIDFDGAESTTNSNTSPWDEEDVVYWLENGKKRAQKRTHIERKVSYQIDLDKLFYIDSMRLCTNINLVNRGNNQHKASLKQIQPYYVSPNLSYAAYQLTTSCGITLGNVLHEAIWSHCGRYLAVVHFEHPPLVPHKISIIDFKTATVKDIAGSYALPSFIWLDKDKLDFTYLVGVQESLNFGNNTESQMTEMRLTDPQYAAEPYRLLVNDLDEMRAAADKKVEKRAHKKFYYGASVNVISQHIMLFAPDFDKAVLQPPLNIKT